MDPHPASVAVESHGPPELSFEPFLPFPVLLVLAVAAVLLGMGSYARSTRPIAPLRKWGLITLRVAAALLILFCLSQPVMVHALTLREKGLCFIALDASASMNLRDAPDGRSRWAYAGKLFADHQAELAELSRHFEIRRWLFGAAPRETPLLPGEEAAGSGGPEDRASDFEAILDRLAGEAGGTPCAGALLIADGRHNTPGDPALAARRLKAAGVPLFVIGIGQEATPEDYQELQIKLLEVPDRSFVGGQVVIKVEVESQLPAPAASALAVAVNDRVIYEEPDLAFKKGQEIVAREIPFSPTELGMHRVTASVRPLPKEANLNNNQKTAYFRVYRNKLGIRYAEGAVRKEFGALRSALQTAPNADLKAVNAFLEREGGAELLPATEEGWAELRLVILGDLPARRFTFEQLERLAAFVEKGGALLMIGGLDNFGPGGWGMTPVSKVMPVEMNRSDGEVKGPLPLVLTEEGAAHPALKLADRDAETKLRWAALPAVPGVNGVGGVKPAAQVLLKAGSRPLLVVQDYGKGRSAAFTMDMTWQWILKAGQEDSHKRFWRSLVTWLTRSEYRDTGKAVFVETDRLQYMLGEEAQLSAQVQETEALAGRIASAHIVATLHRDGQEAGRWAMGRGLGEFFARRSPQLPGNYTYKVEAQGADGKALDSDAVSFRVDVPDVENDNPKADQALLKRLAAASGGTYYDAEHAGAAFAEILKRTQGHTKVLRSSVPLWNHWSIYALFLALLSAEWALRKRWNLP